MNTPAGATDSIATMDPTIALALIGLLVIQGFFMVGMWFISSVVCATAAKRKGYSGFGFFCLAFFATPLIGFLAVIAFPRKFKAVEIEEIDVDDLIEEDEPNGKIPDQPQDFKM